MPTLQDIVEFLSQGQMLAPGESPWPSFDDREYRRYRLDWDSIFPTNRRPVRVGDFEWEMEGDGWEPQLGSEFLAELDEATSSSPPTRDEIFQMARSTRWDVCAWYQAIHYHSTNWGIFIRQDCVLSQALRIARFVQKPARSSRALARALLRASVYSYFLHEQYHHKVESLAIRLEVVDRHGVYLNYHKNVYVPAIGTNNQLEEGLANASVYQRLQTDPYERWISWPIVAATKQFLKATFPHEPPGYSTAVNYLGVAAFENAENALHSRVHKCTITPTQPANEWAVATRLIQSLFNVTDEIWVLVKPSGAYVLASQPWP